MTDCWGRRWPHYGEAVVSLLSGAACRQLCRLCAPDRAGGETRVTELVRRSRVDYKNFPGPYHGCLRTTSQGTYLPYLPTIYGIYISKFGYRVGVGKVPPTDRAQAITPEVITTAWDGSDRLEVVSLAWDNSPAWSLDTFQPIYVTFQGTRRSKNGKIIIKT